MNELFQMIHNGDQIEYLAKKTNIKIWKQGKIDKITENQLEIKTKSNKLKILKKRNITNKLMVK